MDLIQTWRKEIRSGSRRKPEAFFHFTDRRNLQLIREHGLLSLARLREFGIEIPAPGGNKWSHDADEAKGLDEYVHLCLRDNHPMEYLAREDGRIERSIYLQIDLEVLAIEGIKYTPDVSNKSGVETYPIDDTLKMVDFEILYSRTPVFHLDRLQQAERCELLVPNAIPLDLIRNLPDG
ncbi:MAG TPA: DarT ssDNA thymidine ADP-ribosyltransferase family protein [Bryobacterales bacterium]|nr:DarT ssDNA thymidine ADP-ribosyltransferase family protein [Bryobacterales bacterium]